MFIGVLVFNVWVEHKIISMLVENVSGQLPISDTIRALPGIEPGPLTNRVSVLPLH